MGKLGALAVGLVAILAIATVRADDPPTLPADFKIQVSEYRLNKEPVATSDVVVHLGRAYVFPSDSKEVVVIEPARKHLGLVDVGRKVQVDLTFRMLDESLTRITRSLGEAADDREKQGGRANRLQAQMTRDLFETKLRVTETAKAHRVRLTNAAVEVDADGEPETDAARLATVTVTLATIAKLGVYKAPDDLPPFAELEAIAALTGDRKLRPTELAYLYRLNGPPRKFRRTYRLVPSLTDREVEATTRVDRLRDAIPTLRYGQYRTDR